MSDAPDAAGGTGTPETPESAGAPAAASGCPQCGYQAGPPAPRPSRSRRLRATTSLLIRDTVSGEVTRVKPHVDEGGRTSIPSTALWMGFLQIWGGLALAVASLEVGGSAETPAMIGGAVLGLVLIALGAGFFLGQRPAWRAMWIVASLGMLAMLGVMIWQGVRLVQATMAGEDPGTASAPFLAALGGIGAGFLYLALLRSIDVTRYFGVPVKHVDL